MAMKERDGTKEGSTIALHMDGTLTDMKEGATVREEGTMTFLHAESLAMRGLREGVTIDRIMIESQDGIAMSALEEIIRSALEDMMIGPEERTMKPEVQEDSKIEGRDHHIPRIGHDGQGRLLFHMAMMSSEEQRVVTIRKTTKESAAEMRHYYFSLL